MQIVLKSVLFPTCLCVYTDHSRRVQSGTSPWFIRNQASGMWASSSRTWGIYSSLPGSSYMCMAHLLCMAHLPEGSPLSAAAASSFREWATVRLVVGPQETEVCTTSRRWRTSHAGTNASFFRDYSQVSGGHTEPKQPPSKWVDLPGWAKRWCCASPKGFSGIPKPHSCCAGVVQGARGSF